MRFSRQEYWSRLPFPSHGNLPNPGIGPASPALTGGFLTTEPLNLRCPWLLGAAVTEIMVTGSFLKFNFKRHPVDAVHILTIAYTFTYTVCALNNEGLE